MCSGKSGALGRLSYNAKDLEECQSLCYNRPCKYVSYNRRTQYCYGFYTCDSLDYSSDFRTYVKGMYRFITVLWI